MKKIDYIITLLCCLIVASCASMGNPDGGRYDEEPPVIIKASPEEYSINSNEQKVVLTFDEYIKLENAMDKVVVSPPQIEMPDIKTTGKKIIVTLNDTLKPNTTYTIDFADAITDNNEGNPMGDYAFTFSTGEVIDTMQVSGYVLEAKNLEPIKGMLVGLQSDTHDSAFVTKPFERVSRTDSRGHFTIKGVANGSYRVYALDDKNQNFLFDQKSEKIAFSHDIVTTSSRPDIRPDTVWIDSIRYKAINLVPYTHYYPDDIVLTAFQEAQTNQYLKKATRNGLNNFTLVFGTKADTLPILKGLNFDEREAFVLEKTPKNDSITYWVKDTAVYYLDSLIFSLSYMRTDDSLEILVPQTDTLTLVAKRTHAMMQKELKKKQDEWVKNRKKEIKRERKEAARRKETEEAAPPPPPVEGGGGEPQLAEMVTDTTMANAANDSTMLTAPPDTTTTMTLETTTMSSKEDAREPKKEVRKGRKSKDDDDEDDKDIVVDPKDMPADYLAVKKELSDKLAPNKNITLTFEEPIAKIDTAAIHLKHFNKTDSLWQEDRFLVKQSKENIKVYSIYGEWQPEGEYELVVDSAAFTGLYGHVTEKFSNKFKVNALDTYSTLFVKVIGADSTFVVELLGRDEKALESKRVRKDGQVEFFFIEPGAYYLRGFFDRNENGVWDTGCYADDMQAEDMRYFNASLELKANWEINQDWDINSRKKNEQKPAAITKQKPDKEKTIKNRNAERERNM